MIDEGITYGMTLPPTGELIAKGAVYAKDQIKETNTRNAWRHEPYSWFPNWIQKRQHENLYFVHNTYTFNFLFLYICSLLLHFQWISFTLGIVLWCL